MVLYAGPESKYPEPKQCRLILQLLLQYGLFYKFYSVCFTCNEIRRRLLERCANPPGDLALSYPSVCGSERKDLGGRNAKGLGFVYTPERSSEQKESVPKRSEECRSPLHVTKTW